MRWIATLGAALSLAGMFGEAVAQSPGGDPFVFVSAVQEDGSSPEAGAFVWYMLPMSIRPTGTSVAGLPIAAINGFRARQDADPYAGPADPWCFANILSEQSYASTNPVVQADIEASFRNNPDHHFQLRGRFTGQNELSAVIGHAAECDGDKVGFVLLVDPSTTPATLIHVDSLPFESGLQYMRLVDARLTVSTCFECDDLTGLFYDRRRRRFSWQALGD